MSSANTITMEQSGLIEQINLIEEIGKLITSADFTTDLKDKFLNSLNILEKGGIISEGLSTSTSKIKNLLEGFSKEKAKKDIIKLKDSFKDEFSIFLNDLKLVKPASYSMIDEVDNNVTDEVENEEDLALIQEIEDLTNINSEIKRQVERLIDEQNNIAADLNIIESDFNKETLVKEKVQTKYKEIRKQFFVRYSDVMESILYLEFLEKERDISVDSIKEIYNKLKSLKEDFALIKEEYNSLESENNFENLKLQVLESKLVKVEDEYTNINDKIENSKTAVYDLCVKLNDNMKNMKKLYYIN